MGDRAGEGRAYGDLGSTYQSLDDFGKAIEYHTQDLAIAKEWTTWRGRGGSDANLGNADQSLGDFVMGGRSSVY